MSLAQATRHLVVHSDAVVFATPLWRAACASDMPSANTRLTSRRRPAGVGFALLCCIGSSERE